jgi:hypothetical protein
VLFEKSSTVNWVADHLQGGLRNGDVVEIGPLGVGCIHFLPDGCERTAGWHRLSDDARPARSPRCPVLLAITGGGTNMGWIAELVQGEG